jgi:DNA-binding transcriptional LysR family regulator
MPIIAAVELRQLRYFVVLAEELNFRRAAERLFIAQPSLSQQIRRLEGELGVTLLDRDRRRVELTDAGRALLEHAPDVLAGAERAAEAAKLAGSGEHGVLRLSLTRSLPGGVAGRIVDAFRARHPGVELELALGHTTLHVEQLRAGTVDAAFVRPPIADDLAVLELAREPLVCVLPRSHPLAARRRIRREDLVDQPLVWWPKAHGPGPWEAMLGAVYGEDGWPEVSRFEPEEERLVSAVAAGAGISFIMLERSRMLRVPGTVYRRFAPPEPTVGIALAWRRGHATPAIERLVEVARACAEPPG